MDRRLVLFGWLVTSIAGGAGLVLEAVDTPAGGWLLALFAFVMLVSAVEVAVALWPGSKP